MHDPACELRRTPFPRMPLPRAQVNKALIGGTRPHRMASCGWQKEKHSKGTHAMPSAAPVSEGFVSFGGFRIWYRVVGDLAQQEPAKFPLLVLHGGPGGPSDYLEPLEELADAGRPIVFYDQLGCGNSDQPNDPSMWSVELFLEELSTVRQELGLDHIHLLGHSWGGMLAMEYASPSRWAWPASSSPARRPAYPS